MRFSFEYLFLIPLPGTPGRDSRNLMRIRLYDAIQVLAKQFLPRPSTQGFKEFLGLRVILGSALRNKALTRDRDFNPILSAMTSSVGIS